MADVTIISDGTQDYFVKDAVAREDITEIKSEVEKMFTFDTKNNKTTFTSASGSSSFVDVTLTPGSTHATLFSNIAKSVANTKYLNTVFEELSNKNAELEARIEALESKTK